MKIQTNSPSLPSTANSQSDVTNTNTTDDFFFEMMAALLPEMVVENNGEGVSEKKEESKDEDNGESKATVEETDLAKTFLFSPFLAPIKDLTTPDVLEESVNTIPTEEVVAENKEVKSLSSFSEVKIENTEKPAKPEKSVVKTDIPMHEKTAIAFKPNLNETMDLLAPTAAIQSSPTNMPTFFSFHSEQGVLTEVLNNKNKYVNTLAQTGNWIVNQLTNNVNLKVQPATTPWRPEMNGESRAPEYQLQIELLPISANAIENDIYNANIKIYPPELGSIIAKLKIHKENGAELMMVADNHRLKEIVEANLSQLRENFKEADIPLNIVQVSVQNSTTDSNANQHQQNQAAKSFLSQNESTDLNEDKKLSEALTQRLDSLVDTYA